MEASSQEVQERHILDLQPSNRPTPDPPKQSPLSPKQRSLLKAETHPNNTRGDEDCIWQKSPSLLNKTHFSKRLMPRAIPLSVSTPFQLTWKTAPRLSFDLKPTSLPNFPTRALARLRAPAVPAAPQVREPLVHSAEGSLRPTCRCGLRGR